MTSNKLVVKCGNFAVLVDLHVLPRGSSKDTSWFSDHEKEEVCMLLKDPVDARVKQYIEARKHHGQLKHKEFTQCSPLFLRGDRFRIAAYFMKRWVNLRCILKQKYRELRVFPDRFVVCASPHEPALTPWIKESIALKENISSETSEYFIRCTETGKGNIPSTTQKQQGILKEIIKKTKISKGNMIKPLAREMLLGSVDSKTDDKKNEDQSPLDLPSEAQCSRAAEPLDCIKTSGSSLEPPVSELENNTNRRQLDDASSQQKLHSVEGLKTRLIVRKLPCSSESELPDSKQCQSTTTQQKRTRHFSEENLRVCKKTAFGRDGCIPGDAAIIQKSNVECSMQTLDPKLSRQDLTKTAFKEKLLTWRNIYLPSVLSSNMEQINQNKPLSNSEQCPLIPISSHLKMSCSPTEILLPECKKKVENQPRKLKLQRIKKS